MKIVEIGLAEIQHVVAGNHASCRGTALAERDAAPVRPLPSRMPLHARSRPEMPREIWPVRARTLSTHRQFWTRTQGHLDSATKSCLARSIILAPSTRQEEPS